MKPFPLLLVLLLSLPLAGGQVRQPGAQAAPPAPQVYRWKDDKGKIQMTNTPPPPGAVVLEAPPPPMALEADTGPKVVVRQSGNRSKPSELSPGQKAAWEALDLALSEARRKGDRATLQAVASSLIRDSRWGNGLGFVAFLPFVALALLSCLGWWAGYTLPRAQRLPLVGTFVLTGLVLGHLLLTHFLYRPQFYRLRLNLTFLTDYYLGGDLRVGPRNREALQAHWSALEAASTPASAPWRFPAEVEALEETMKRVMVEP